LKFTIAQWSLQSSTVSSFYNNQGKNYLHKDDNRPRPQCLKITRKVSFNTCVYILSGEKFMVQFGDILKTWSLRSNSVTRQLNFTRTKIGGKSDILVIFKQCVQTKSYLHKVDATSVCKIIDFFLANYGNPDNSWKLIQCLFPICQYHSNLKGKTETFLKLFSSAFWHHLHSE